MRALNVLLSLLVSAAIGLGIFELGLRVFPQFRPPSTLNRFDPVLGWSKEPGKSVGRTTQEFSIRFRINAQGLRDDPVAVPKPEGTFRIVCLGDSFVLGYTVDRHDLFVDILERAYQAGARNVELVNSGTEGWSTDQEVLWYQEQGAALQPDLVLLFPYENDIYWNGQQSYYRFPKPRYEPDGALEQRTLVDPGPAPFLQHTAIGRALGMLLGSLAPMSSRPHTFEAAPGVWIPAEFTPLLVHQPPLLDDALARTRGALTALRNTCSASGTPLAVCPIPSESAIQPSSRAQFEAASGGAGMDGLDPDLWSPDRPVEFFLGMAHDLGIPTLDPRPALHAAHEAHPEEPLYFDAEWHLTPHGNRVLAHYLADALDADGLVPAPPPEALGAATADPPLPGGPPTALWVFLLLWAGLGTAYALTYRGKEPVWRSYLGVGALLLAIFAIVLGGNALLGHLPLSWRPALLVVFLLVILGFVGWKMGRRLGTIAELLKAFALRGHWYLMPLVVVLLSIGSLLVVAASSPLIAPFIYTLF